MSLRCPHSSRVYLDFFRGVKEVHSQAHQVRRRPFTTSKAASSTSRKSWDKRASAAGRYPLEVEGWLEEGPDLTFHSASDAAGSEALKEKEEKEWFSAELIRSVEKLESQQEKEPPKHSVPIPDIHSSVKKTIPITTSSASSTTTAPPPATQSVSERYGISQMFEKMFTTPPVQHKPPPLPVELMSELFEDTSAVDYRSILTSSPFIRSRIHNPNTVPPTQKEEKSSHPCDLLRTLVKAENWKEAAAFKFALQNAGVYIIPWEGYWTPAIAALEGRLPPLLNGQDNSQGDVEPDPENWRRDEKRLELFNLWSALVGHAPSNPKEPHPEGMVTAITLLQSRYPMHLKPMAKLLGQLTPFGWAPRIARILLRHLTFFGPPEAVTPLIWQMREHAQPLLEDEMVNQWLNQVLHDLLECGHLEEAYERLREIKEEEAFERNQIADGSGFQFDLFRISNLVYTQMYFSLKKHSFADEARQIQEWQALDDQLNMQKMKKYREEVLSSVMISQAPPTQQLPFVRTRGRRTWWFEKISAPPPAEDLPKIIRCLRHSVDLPASDLSYIIEAIRALPGPLRTSLIDRLEQRNRFNFILEDVWFDDMNLSAHRKQEEGWILAEMLIERRRHNHEEVLRLFGSTFQWIGLPMGRRWEEFRVHSRRVPGYVKLKTGGVVDETRLGLDGAKIWPSRYPVSAAMSSLASLCQSEDELDEAWNSWISNANHSDGSPAFDFRIPPEKEPDSPVYASFALRYVHLSTAERAMGVIQYMMDHEIPVSRTIWNIVLGGMAQRGMYDEVLSGLERMEKATDPQDYHDKTTYTAMGMKRHPVQEPAKANSYTYLTIMNNLLRVPSPNFHLFEHIQGRFENSGLRDQMDWQEREMEDAILLKYKSELNNVESNDVVERRRVNPPKKFVASNYELASDI